jgi:four helix bundle protein
MNHYKGYKDLECYKQGRELRILISLLCNKFSNEEKYELTSQMRPSSRSVTANIAEGYGRYTYSDTRHFFIIARGSITETMEHLATAFDENYITPEELLLHETKCETVFKLINGYIAYLDKSKREQKSPNIPITNS